MVNRYFSIWKAFFRNTLSRDMEFKLNFIFEIFIDAVYYFSLFFFFKIIFQFTNSLGEFNQDAVIIFLITLYLADSLYVFFLGGNVFNINNAVKQGDLDFILLNLERFNDEDFLLLVGDPAIIAVAAVVASGINNGKFKLLKWDRIASKYYPLSIDLYNKEKDNE